MKTGNQRADAQAIAAEFVKVMREFAGQTPGLDGKNFEAFQVAACMGASLFTLVAGLPKPYHDAMEAQLSKIGEATVPVPKGDNSIALQVREALRSMEKGQRSDGIS